MPTAEEIVVKLTAQNDELKAGMADASATVKANTDAMAASFKQSTAAFAAFDAIEKANLRTAEQVAAAQKTINDVQATGAFTSEELAAKQTLVSAALAKVEKDSQAAATGIAAITNNSRAAYSASALLSDVMTGQFSRSRREVAALANETGLMSKALQFALSPAGLVAAALAAVGVAALQAEEDFAKLRQSIGAGGGMAGMDEQQLENLAQHFKQMGFDVHDTRTAIEQLSSAGTVTRDAMQNATLAVMQTAQVTGQQADKVAQEISRAMAGGFDGILKLDEKYKFLNDSQLKTIENLEKSGSAAEAQKQAFGDLANSMGAVIQAHGGTMDSFWQRFGTTVANTWDTIAHGVNKDTQQQIDKLNEQIQYYQRIGVSQETINKLIKQRNELEAQAAANAQAAAQRGQVAEARYNRDEAAAHHHGGGKGGGSGAADEQAFQQAQYAAQQQGHEMSLAEQRAWWQKRLEVDQAGGAADANATAAAMRHVVELQKQMDTQAATSGRETARKRAQAAKQEAREEEQSAREAAQAKLAADEQTVENAHTIATARIHAAVEGYQDEAAAGRITAKQLLDDQEAALRQQLTADIGYYQARARLAAGDQAEVAKWNAAIVADKIKTNAELLAADKRYQEELKRIQQEVTNEKVRDDQRMIMSGFQEVNALIGHQETWKQAMRNIGMQVLEQQEQDVAKGIAEALNGEQGKTAAAAAGASERLGITVAGEAQALMVQGEAAVKWIMTEAAKAAAGAFNALVSIPYVGPFLAVGASIAAFAAVSKLVSSVASAEGGWERVPADGVMTELHRDEMVLPAHFANPMRDMVKNGGGMGGVHHHHYNIQAYDRRGLADFVARHGSELGHGVRRLGRNGHRL